MNKKNAFRRGFTLIELMIVIVILGILMGTILPRLTGAQARARDTARKADLTNISQALEVYYGDTGSYPPMPKDACLNDLDDTEADGDGPSDKTVYEVLSEYMKGNKVPAAVSKEQMTMGCKGAYFYKPLKSGGIDKASYVLASDVETWQLANFVAGPVASSNADNMALSSTTPVTIDETFVITADADLYTVKMGALTGEALNTQRTIFIVIP